MIREQTSNNEETETLRKSCFQETVTNVLNNQTPLLVDCFKTSNRKERYLMLFSSYIVYAKQAQLDFTKPVRIKILHFNFEIAFYVKRAQQSAKKYSAIKFVNMNTKQTDTFYHENEQIVTRWTSFLLPYLNQVGIQEYFRTIRQLGKGVSAQVYLAERIQDNRQFAVKVFNKTKNNDKCQSAFKNQIKILRLLNHPNIIKLYGVFVSSEYIYAVLQYLSGGTLYEQIKQVFYLKSKKKLYNRDEQYIIINDLLQGLEHLRLKRIVHRDLKLQNILIRAGNPKNYVICDFGLATWIDEKSYIFEKCGTPGYIAPEILRLGKQEKMLVDSKADVFSLGAIFHLIMLSRPAFTYKGDFKELLKLNKKCYIDFKTEKYAPLDKNQLELLILMLDENPKRRPSSDQIFKLDYFRKKKVVRSQSSQRNNALQEQQTPNSKRILKSVDRIGSVQVKDQKKTGFNRNASLNKNVSFESKQSKKESKPESKSSFLDFFFKKNKEKNEKDIKV